MRQYRTPDHLDNILLPYRINRSLDLDGEVRRRTVALADRVGLADKLQRYPSQLSQGERQRVAVCRAVLAQPAFSITGAARIVMPPWHSYAVSPR